jgi:hypothetical protein
MSKTIQEKNSYYEEIMTAQVRQNRKNYKE